MALAVLAAGGLRAALPAQLRSGDARWAFIVVVVVLLAVLVIGDPGRIDRDSAWLRAFTATLIGLITAVNAAAAVRLVAGIIGAAKFSTDANVLLASGGAIWLSNVIAFGLWYWDLDRGGAAARARGSDRQPAFVFPEMSNASVRKPRLVPEIHRLPPSLVHHRDGVQPDGCLGHQALGQADDDGGGGDLAASRDPRRLQGRQHPRVAAASQQAVPAATSGGPVRPWLSPSVLSWYRRRAGRPEDPPRRPWTARS